jgi:transcriptional regulator with XRE-family HTH domain
MNETESISARLGQALAAKGWTGSELAGVVGVSAGAVSQWLNDKKEPRRDKMERIAEALGVDVSWLEYGTGAGPGIDLEALRAAYRNETGWGFRGVPEDKGVDLGNASAFVFDPDIETFTREVGQNVLDVVRGASALLNFRFIRLTGAALDRFLEALRWGELQGHLEAAAHIDQKVGRSLRAGLNRLENREELLLLRVEEIGTTGLAGGEDGLGSNFAALVRNTLDSHKASTAGGAFGLGKAVLWRASSLSTVLFNSDLAVPLGDKSQGRLIGRSELSWHEVDGRQHAGPGWFGRLEGERAVSEWGNQALAKDLCLERPAGTTGTSTLIVGFHDPSSDQGPDPKTLAEEIQRAVARHFWPALQRGSMAVAVEVAEGPSDADVVQRTVVDPARVEPEFMDLIAKHQADEVAESLEQEGDVVRRTATLKLTACKDGSHGEIEHQAVVLIRRASDEAKESNRIAFYRGPGMIVQHRDAANIRVGARPFHAAVLCGEAASTDPAATAAEKFLRLAEPPAHHRWERTPDVAALYARGSKKALDLFFEEVTQVVRELVGPASQDLSDGPRGLKELLRITGGSDETTRPRITKGDGKVDDQGRWEVTATVTVKPEPNVTWSGRPVVLFTAETGGGTKVGWEQLEAVNNCEVDDGRLVISTGKRQARFRGVTDATTHPVPAGQAVIGLDFRGAERTAGTEA